MRSARTSRMRAFVCDVSVTIPACEPVSEIARWPRSLIAIAQSAHDTRSPVDSSMSISRGSGSGETSSASAMRRSVSLPRALSTATTRWPAARLATMRRAARLRRSASATDVPPNFITTVLTSVEGYPARSARQRELEAGAVLRRHGAQVAAHAPGQLAPDRQSEPEARRPLARGAALEAPEDARVLARREPRAAVGDAHDRGVAAGHDRRRDEPPARAVAQRVVEQDAEDPRDRGLVGGRQRAVAVELERDAGLAGARVELRVERGGDLAQLDRLGAQRNVAVEPAEVEQVRRQAREPPRLAGGGDGAAAGAVDVGLRRGER